MRFLCIALFASGCLQHYRVQPDSGETYRLKARRLFWMSTFEVQILDAAAGPLSIAPASARLTSQKCEARLGGWQYAQGGGATNFAGVDVQLEHRLRVMQSAPILKPESAMGVINEDKNPFWVDAPQDRRFTLRTGGWLLLRYDIGFRAECAPYSFQLTTEGGPSISATLRE